MKSFLPDPQPRCFQLPALPEVWAPAKRFPPPRSRTEHRCRPPQQASLQAQSQRTAGAPHSPSSSGVPQIRGTRGPEAISHRRPPPRDLPGVHLQPGFQLPRLRGIGAGEDLATLHVDHFDREVAHLARLVQRLRNQSQAAGQYFGFSASKQSLRLHQHLPLRPNPPQDHRNNHWEEQNGRLLEIPRHQRTGKARKLTRFRISL